MAKAEKNAAEHEFVNAAFVKGYKDYMIENEGVDIAMWSHMAGLAEDFGGPDPRISAYCRPCIAMFEQWVFAHYRSQ